jgi:dienelactone hydrolase
MKIKLTHLSFIALCLFGLVDVRLEASPLWGNLKPGPYAVGYKTLFTYDLARPPLANPAGAGASSSRTQGRQMQISIWYPAKTLKRSSQMRFEEYVFLQSSELNFGPLTEEKRRQSKKMFMEGPLARGASADKLEALMGMETAAVKNASPVTGRFPLIVFAHGSPPTQSIMCEYLASHGFVVAAVPSKGSFEYDFDVALSGLETLITDMEFVLASLKTLPQVDGKRLGLIGMSFGSAGVVGLQTRNPDVRAMISLDGGIGEGGVSFLLTRTPYYDVSRIKAPLLHLYTSNNPNLDLSRIDSYKYSTRYLVTIPRMRHGDFVAYGMFEQFVPKMFGESPGDTKTGFEWVCRYSLRFLQAYLSNDMQGLAFLQRSPAANEVPEGILTMSVKPGLPNPPTTREIKALLETGGIKKLVALYTERKVLDAQPFTKSSFIEVSDWLLSRKQLDVAKELCRLFLESYPDSVRAHYALANVAEQSGDSELAKTHFAQTLRLINDDPDLDYRTRKRLEQAASQGLSRLK